MSGQGEQTFGDGRLDILAFTSWKLREINPRLKCI